MSKEEKQPEIKIKVDGDSIERKLREKMELEKENSALKEKLGNGKTEPSEDELKNFARKLLKLQDSIMEEEIAEDIAKKESQKGGKGTIPMTKEMVAKEHGGSANKSFSNNAEMVSYLKEQIRKGDATAKEQYRELVKKSVNALKSKPVVWTDSNPEEPSMIQNILSERNKKFREKLESN